MPRTWIPAPAKGMAIGDTDPSFAAEIKNYVFQQDGSLLVCPAPSAVSSETWTDYGLPVEVLPALVGTNAFLLIGTLQSQGSTWTKVTSITEDSYYTLSVYGYGLFFKPDGTKFYTTSIRTEDNGAIAQYSLSTAWDLTTASHEKTIHVSDQTQFVGDVAFKQDGTKMYVTDETGEKIFQYSLSTPWDIGTASYEGKVLTVEGTSVNLGGIVFGLNGSKMYVIDINNVVLHQFNLSDPWDIETATLFATLDLSAQTSDPYGVTFNPDGTFLYITGTGVGERTIYVYSLSTAWDISSASYDSSLSTGDQGVYDIVFKTDGTKLYGTALDKLYQYSATSSKYTNFPYCIRFYDLVNDTFEDYLPCDQYSNFSAYNIPLFNPYSSSTAPWAFVGGWGNQRSIKIKVSSDSTWRYLGIEAPTQAPSAAAGNAGSLDGTYYFRYTYYDSSLDIESNGSPASDAVTVANQEVDLSNIAGTGQPGVDKIRIYGLGGAVTEYMLIATIDNPGEGQTTSYTVSTAESEWGQNIPTDHDPPPSDIVYLEWNEQLGRLFAIDDDGRLWWSSSWQPDYWPTDNYIDTGRKLLALATFRGTTYAFDQHEAFQVVGPINDTFELRKVADIGIISPTAIRVTNAGIMGITPSKTVFLFAGGFAKSIGEQIEPFLKGEYLPGSYYGYNLWVVSQAGDKGFVTIAEVAQDGSELDIKSIYTFVLHSEGKWTMDGHGYMAFCDDPQFQPPDITTGSSYWGDNDARRGLRLIAMLPNGKPYYYYLSPQATYPDNTSPSPDSLNLIQSNRIFPAGPGRKFRLRGFKFKVHRVQGTPEVSVTFKVDGGGAGKEYSKNNISITTDYGALGTFYPTTNLIGHYLNYEVSISSNIAKFYGLEIEWEPIGGATEPVEAPA